MLIQLISTLLVSRPHEATAFQPHLLSSTLLRRHPLFPLARSYDGYSSVLRIFNQNNDTILTPKEGESSDSDEQLDTIRVRIWRQLADGKELSLSELSNAVGERRLGELRSHLTHVEKQAKTIRNKSNEWRVRRGLSPAVGNTGKAGAPRKMKLKFRKGKRNETFVSLS
ncbi:hypothetical protein ACHAWT_006891 [Skeletonema menzelii]